MKKKIVSMLLITAVSAFALSACGGNNQTVNSQTEVTEEVKEEVVSEAEASDATDEEKAAEVAALIDAIYVQQRTDETDAQCRAAKEAWDALTDAQKDLVEGEEADPDYFGRDTGDATLDDSLNADEIGDNEILVVSFGTSFNDSRAKDIKGIEDAIQAEFSDFAVRRAFTAQIIINHVQARDEEFIDNMDQALERAVANNVKNLVVQPTHLMHGAEYDEMCEALESYADKFETIAIAEPLLGEVGSDATVINEDKKMVAEAVVNEALNEAGFDSIEATDESSVAFVFMGHGTSHNAKVSYSQMQTQMETLGYKNVFIGTVEGEPEETECSNVIEKIKEAGYKNVVLRPLMVVAGDHANNDMAGDDKDSWKSMFVAADCFETVDCQIAGLGRIDKIKEIYVAHTKEAIENVRVSVEASKEAATDSEKLEDGTYKATFDTDSGMFHVNEANEGIGELTVRDGEMTIHVSLAGKGILNLFVGTAGDAAKSGAVLLEPTEDEVTYSDGTKETVYGFDIPVPYLDKEFDCALIGEKGKWYDHKVSVSNVQK